MSSRMRNSLVLGIILLAILALIAGTVFIAQLFFFPPGGGALWGRIFGGGYRSNGEQIYFTGTSRTGPPITANMEGMHEMRPGWMACVSCHGENGEGGSVRMMMGSFTAPDIRYQTLMGENHEASQDEHPPYTEDTLKQAITRGIDPAGEALDWPMPRWNMTEEQVEDLIDFLKTLQ